MAAATEQETVEGHPALYADSVQAWRDWLEANGRTSPSIWLIVHHLDSDIPSVHFQEAIEHGLCYGWVDSKAIKRDHGSFLLKFQRRNPKSSWGKKNRERAQKMIDLGLMAEAGQEAIDHARRTGRWDAHADAQNEIVPPDLKAAFDSNPVAFGNFQAFPPSSKRLILEWISKAVKPETRERRITQTVEMAEVNERANHPRSHRRG